MSRVTLRVTVACCVLAGCGSDEPPPADDPAMAAAGDSILADSVFQPAEDVVTLPSRRIYYTLTSYEWYAHGEPLVHDGRPYQPDGMPVAASLTEMTQAGDYHGVEYYVRSGDPEAVVYVPVFDGYWQRFRADASALALPADTQPAHAADADTMPADTTTLQAAALD